MPLATTERTVIELLTVDDAAFVLDLVTSPPWLRFIGDRGVHDVEGARRFLAERLLATYETLGFGHYAVRTRDGRTIGACGFLQKSYLEHPDFGFAYLPAFHRQGYGYEAGAAILDYGARELGFEVQDAVTRRDNTASMKLLAKLGFAAAGEARPPDEPPLLLHRWHRDRRLPSTDSVHRENS